MDALKREMVLKEAEVIPENAEKSPPARFTISGEEVIEKVVKPGGSAGRVYLPCHWVGKRVKIIRIN